MNKDEFNNLPVDDQVKEINLLIDKLGSVRKATENIGIAKSTIQNRFSKHGYTFLSDLKKYAFGECVVDVKKVPFSGKNDSPSIDYNSLNSCSLDIHLRLNRIAKNFIKIGIMLVHIQENKLFKQGNYNNLLDFSYSEFGLSKTVTYNLISVSKKFSINGAIKEEYKDFKFSQLVEMISIPENKIELVDSDMEVKDIREVKKNIDKLKNIQDTPRDHKEKFKKEDSKEEIVQEVSFLQLDYKENIIKYLNDRLEVLKGLVKSNKGNDEFKGALHEVDLLLNCISKNEI